jgi:hypothetical protein
VLEHDQQQLLTNESPTDDSYVPRVEELRVCWRHQKGRTIPDDTFFFTSKSNIVKKRKAQSSTHGVYKIGG